MTEDKALPIVKIKIGEAEYSLLYSMYALGKLKKVAKINALKGEVDILDPDHILFFLWAGLITNHPEFDGEMIAEQPDKKLGDALKKLGTILTFKSFNSIGSAIKEAFNRATLPDKSDEAESPAEKN